MNSDAYDRENQNNSRLSELSAKVTALRGVTVDIYDNARAQDVIDNTVRLSRVPCHMYLGISVIRRMEEREGETESVEWRRSGRNLS